MRKLDQKRMLNVLDSLGEAEGEVRRLCRNKDYGAAVALLGDCQDAVAGLVGFLENLGEGERTIELLAECYKLFYDVASDIENASSGSVKRLGKAVYKLENSVRDECVPNRLEVVFFPYKASMWDCFDSVWRAANEDPACDVYVVSVPYYDRVNGKLGSAHNESGEYPAYVHMTDWSDYDHTERRPDVMFIHNPYDDTNIITAVDSRYFASEQKKHTDCLVYIPYFVSKNVHQHYVTVPGALYADRVVVQSEADKRKYVQLYQEFCKTRMIGESYGKADEKFLALGSPKLDQVINAKPEDFTLPDEWARMMEKPGGGRKTVVLYNTSISTLLEGNREVLDKLRYVFEVFRGRENALLWWRPHPLSADAYRTMRPALLREYEALVEEYRREGFGIYDDSADSQRALCLADALYGEGGSLMTMFAYTGKPVIWQNLTVNLRDSGFDRLGLFNITETGHRCWVTLRWMDGLLEIDRESGAVAKAILLPNRRRRMETQYNRAVPVGGELVMIPEAAESIAFYNPETGGFREIALSWDGLRRPEECRRDIKFRSMYQYGNAWFFAPAGFPAVVRYSLTEGTLDYYGDWANEFQTKHLFMSSAGSGAEIVMVSHLTNKVLFFDMKTRKSAVRRIGKDSFAYTAAHYDGRYLWLAQRNEGPLFVRWDNETGKTLEIPAAVPGFLGGLFPCTDLIMRKRKLWMIPYHANKAAVLDCATLETDEVPELSGEYTPDIRNAESFISASVKGDRLTLIPARRNAILEFGFETRTVSENTVVWSEEQIGGILDKASRRVPPQPGEGQEYSYIEQPVRLEMGMILDNLEEIACGPREEQAEYFRKKIANGDGKGGERIYFECGKGAGL